MDNFDAEYEVEIENGPLIIAIFAAISSVPLLENNNDGLRIFF